MSDPLHIYAGCDSPDSAHQRVDEELVLFRWGLFPGVPHLAVASLHEPPLQVHRVANERI